MRFVWWVSGSMWGKVPEKIRWKMRHEKLKSMNTWRLGPWVLRGNCGMKPGWEMHKRWDQLFKILRSQWGDGNGATGSLMGLFWGINLKKLFIRPFIRPILSDTKGIWQVPGKKTWTLKIPKKRRFGWRLGCACIRLAIILPAISGIPAENTLLVELVAFLIPLPIW